MPKVKTNSSAAKRFTRTATGKYKRARALVNHILTKKTRKRKRNLRKNVVVHAVDQRRLSKLMPYL